MVVGSRCSVWRTAHGCCVAIEAVLLGDGCLAWLRSGFTLLLLCVAPEEGYASCAVARQRVCDRCVSSGCTDVDDALRVPEHGWSLRWPARAWHTGYPLRGGAGTDASAGLSDLACVRVCVRDRVRVHRPCLRDRVHASCPGLSASRLHCMRSKPAKGKECSYTIAAPSPL